ncbi:MAG: 2,3-bisphosphoglycerate-independent phosphoglycerate mutase [Oscillospiraceae bacterium]
MKKPVVLAILDGFGISNEIENNAIKKAKTPNIDSAFKESPYTELTACGLEVGLPEGQMGNSEVGHTNIGAGRIVYQDLTKITKDIKEGHFFNNEALLWAIKKCQEKGTKLHIIGLLSDGGVHSHTDHLKGLIDMCVKNNFRDLIVHPILDGRDTFITSGKGFLQDAIDYMTDKNCGIVGSLSGRFYAMDRDNRWERVEESYNAITQNCDTGFVDPVLYVEQGYKNGINDEFIKPAFNQNSEKMKNGDSVIFMNFRPDRAREITKAFIDPKFDNFNREQIDVNFVSMTNYFETVFDNLKVAYKKDKISNTLGEILSREGLKQLRISETEKYAHVTFFFNAGVEKEIEGEDRVLIPSPKVETYDEKPEMSGHLVTEKLIEEINRDYYDVIIVNFANCDMVGHTGVFEAAVKAVETVDECVGKLIEKVKEKCGVTIVTADHGNADVMWNEKGVVTSHTLNKVPFCIIGCDEIKLKDDGVLSDISPTILDIINKKQPKEMTGTSLILK